MAYCERLAKLIDRGIDIEAVIEALYRLQVETPSWGYGYAGTRFKVFHQPGAARNIYERLADAAQVHRFTGICPRVAIHIPWDRVDDYRTLAAYARELGLTIGTVNPNLFQDDEYRLGSLCHPDPGVRRRALDHLLECVQIAIAVGSDIVSLWLPDGTNYPGQGSFRLRKAWLEQALAEVYSTLPSYMRLLLEYKFFEPAFYHTDIPDWGTAYALANKLGRQAHVLVDLGHHPQGTNVEQIVAFLLSEDKLGGFHFNARRYADDDLMVGTTNPFELFLIFNELVEAEGGLGVSSRVAFMIDQSPNVEPPIEAMIQSVVNVQAAYARALIVDRPALERARLEGNVIDAYNVLASAFHSDVTPLLVRAREAIGLPPDPLAAFRASGYATKIAKERN